MFRWRVNNAQAWNQGLINFVCRIGHVYSAAELLAAKEELLERRLWIGSRPWMSSRSSSRTSSGLESAPATPRPVATAASPLREQAVRLRSIIEADRPAVLRGARERSMRDAP